MKNYFDTLNNSQKQHARHYNDIDCYRTTSLLFVLNILVNERIQQEKTTFRNGGKRNQCWIGLSLCVLCALKRFKQETVIVI
jgi:hypothetical protein